MEKIKMREKSSKGFLKEVTFDSCLAGGCRREWLPTPAFLPGEFHGERNPRGYSPWGRKESDTTERLSLLLYFRAQISFIPIIIQCHYNK